MSKLSRINTLTSTTISIHICNIHFSNKFRSQHKSANPFENFFSVIFEIRMQILQWITVQLWFYREFPNANYINPNTEKLRTTLPLDIQIKNIFAQKFVLQTVFNRQLFFLMNIYSSVRGQAIHVWLKYQLTYFIIRKLSKLLYMYVSIYVCRKTEAVILFLVLFFFSISTWITYSRDVLVLKSIWIENLFNQIFLTTTF